MIQKQNDFPYDGLQNDIETQIKSWEITFDAEIIKLN